MALGSKNSGFGPKRPVIYVRLRHGADGGFQQVMPDGATLTHSEFSGRIDWFGLRQEVTAAKAKELRASNIDPRTVDLEKLPEKDKQLVASMRVRDDDPAEPDVQLSFSVDDSLASKIVGAANALRLNNQLTSDGNANPVVALKFFHRPAKSKYNDGTKDKDSMNLFFVGEDGRTTDKIQPVFMASEHVVYKAADGSDNLPMGEHKGVGTKHEYWDFSERDNIVIETAVSVAQVFLRQQPAPADNDGGDGVDLNEAAAAAAPQA